MKKILIDLIALTMVFVLASCEPAENKLADNKPKTVQLEVNCGYHGGVHKIEVINGETWAAAAERNNDLVIAGNGYANFSCPNRTALVHNNTDDAWVMGTDIVDTSKAYRVN